jgi:hypothetical protein
MMLEPGSDNIQLSFELLDLVSQIAANTDLIKRLVMGVDRIGKSLGLMAEKTDEKKEKEKEKKDVEMQTEEMQTDGEEAEENKKDGKEKEEKEIGEEGTDKEKEDKKSSSVRVSPSCTPVESRWTPAEGT